MKFVIALLIAGSEGRAVYQRHSTPTWWETERRNDGKLYDYWPEPARSADDKAYIR
jgi:hypothetical protein